MARSNEEPILWAEQAVRETRPKRVKGKKVVQRFPQTSPGLPNRHTWVIMVDGAGNTVFGKLTNGAADLDTSSPFAQKVRAKWRDHGWFPLGSCPIALAMVGETLTKDALDESVTAGATPCEPGSYSEKEPCPHALKEIEVRRAAQAADMAERLPKMRDLKDDLVDAQRSQAELNRELVAGLGNVVKEAVAAVAGAAQGGTEPPPEPPPRGKAGR